MSTFECWLSRDDGTRIQILDLVGPFSYTLALNNIGSFTLTLPANFPRDLLAYDRRVLFWRKPDGGGLRLEFVGFVRLIDTTAPGGFIRRIVSGPDCNDLLNRRIVAYYAASAQASKTATGDNFILQLVRDNLGDDTTVAARKLSSTYLDVQANPSLGPSITKAYAWRNLLDVIREVSDATRKAGSVVYFGIVPVTETQFQMRVQLTQWGRDRTADSGYPLTFSLENENLANPHLVEDARDEVTTAYGLGDGEDSQRDVQTSTDTAREGVSVFGRREAAINAVGNATASVLDAADGRVNKGRPVTYFTATLLSVPGCIYGVDWGFGDLVTVSFDGRQFDALIRAVTVSVDENGKETLQCVLEAML